MILDGGPEALAVTLASAPDMVRHIPLAGALARIAGVVVLSAEAASLACPCPLARSQSACPALALNVYQFLSHFAVGELAKTRLTPASEIIGNCRHRIGGPHEHIW